MYIPWIIWNVIRRTVTQKYRLRRRSTGPVERALQFRRLTTRYAHIRIRTRGRQNALEFVPDASCHTDSRRFVSKYETLLIFLVCFQQASERTCLKNVLLLLWRAESRGATFHGTRSPGRLNFIHWRPINYLWFLSKKIILCHPSGA